MHRTRSERRHLTRRARNRRRGLLEATEWLDFYRRIGGQGLVTQVLEGDVPGHGDREWHVRTARYNTERRTAVPDPETVAHVGDVAKWSL